MSLKKTKLYDEHIKLGARMVPFAGWEMPVQYTNLKEEHLCVRQGVGLFDVSHMGEIFFRGEKALESLQYMTTNDVSKLEKGQAHYSLIPNSDGGIVDDIIVYCVEKNQEYLVCANAANLEKDFQYFIQHNLGAEIVNESDEWSQIAIQGPKAFSLIDKVLDIQEKDLASFHFVSKKIDGVDAIIARTGYTGEDGVEVFIKNNGAAPLWQALLDQGAQLGVQAIGLGARDTLRLEKKFPLYGHELNDQTSPVEAGLSWVVKLGKGKFIGSEKIAQVKEAGAKKKLIGLELIDKGIPRDNYQVFSSNEEEIGIVTSGTMSPSSGKAIAIAYIESSYAALDTELKVDIRGRKARALVVKTPFI